MPPFRVLALAAAAALTLTACGQSSSLPAPTNAPDISPSDLAAFASSTQKGGSARSSVLLSVPVKGGTVEYKGVGKFTLSAPIQGQMAMVIRATGRKKVLLEERIIGKTLYMSSPVFRRTIPGSRRWVQVDLSKKSGGASETSLTQVPASQSGEAISFLRGASSDVQNLGTSQLHGVTVTHYRAMINFDAVINALTLKQRGTMRATIRQLAYETGSPTMPVDFWVSADGRLRAEQYKIASVVHSGSVVARVEFYDFGVPVHVTAPPASQITKLR
jgi:hypothetical protein